MKARSLIISLIKGYQWTLRPFFGASCRFYPTCSDYAIEALKIHGCYKGSRLITRRLFHCHPWNPGGVDFVPPKTPKYTPDKKTKKH